MGAPPPSQQSGPGPASGTAPPSEADVFNAIERLGKLRADGLLTEEEFAAKKSELLGRL
jgi:hypothetical protein